MTKENMKETNERRAMTKNFGSNLRTNEVKIYYTLSSSSQLPHYF